MSAFAIAQHRPAQFSYPRYYPYPQSAPAPPPPPPPPPAARHMQSFHLPVTGSTSALYPSAYPPNTTFASGEEGRTPGILRTPSRFRGKSSGRSPSSSRNRARSASARRVSFADERRLSRLPESRSRSRPRVKPGHRRTSSSSSNSSSGSGSGSGPSQGNGRPRYQSSVKGRLHEHHYSLGTPANDRFVTARKVVPFLTAPPQPSRYARNNSSSHVRDHSPDQPRHKEQRSRRRTSPRESSRRRSNSRHARRSS